MRNWIMATGFLLFGMCSCNAPEAVLEASQTAHAAPLLTLADVIPVMQPQSSQAKARYAEFLKENVARFKSKKLAGDYYVMQAKRTFNEEKLDSAALYFGRAWLMDSTNNDVYWGYGRIYGEQKQFDKSLFALYHALEADQENTQLLTDIATSHLGRFYETSDLNDLQQSRKLLEQALKLAPSQADTYYKLAINSYYLREYGKAWDYLHQSLSKGKEVADNGFISALLEKQHDPMGIYTTTDVP